MTSEARDLGKSKEVASANPVLKEPEQIVAALLSHKRFDEFQKNVLTDNQIRLHGSETSLLITYPHALEALDLQSINDNELVVLCMTGDDKSALLHEQESQLAAKLVYLHLPVTLEQLQNQIAAFLAIQQRLTFASAQHNDVEETNESIKYVLKVSRELNGIRDTNKLLSLILKKAREICSADAGSIYVVEWESGDEQKGDIHFKITQNESVHLNLQEFLIPINKNSIVGNAVLHEKSINIPDLYKLNPDRNQNPYRAQHDRSWDDRIGYQCRSMLTVPMFDIANRVIGVIQLINRKKKGVGPLVGELFETGVEAFGSEAVEFAEIIAHQAGIALENALLTEEREQLFEGFVHASVTAIEQRDPTTSGHSHRVALLTLETAKLLDKAHSGPFARTKFSEDQLKEIEYASLLHDFGKLGVREEVLVKAKKLYPLEKKYILERFDHARTAISLDFYRELKDFYDSPENFPPGTSFAILEARFKEQLTEIDGHLDFILKCNEPTVLEQGGFEKLKDIANLTFCNSNHRRKQLLLDNELKALSVSRGSLTREEFAEIQSHVTHTYEFLRKIPWGTTFSNVPQIAAKHHEKLDGSGYPTGAHDLEIPIQSRIMTIADIFDALTAADRPYKRSVPPLKALDIIEMEVRSGKVDKELFNAFTESKIYELVIP